VSIGNELKKIKMKNKLIARILSLTVILAFFSLPLAMNGQGTKANFSGNWAFNADKSDMGQPPQGQGQGQRMGGFGGGDFSAKQEANLLTVDRTRTTPEGQTMTVTSKYTLDGKESINTSPRGQSKSIATWSVDGKSLTIVTTRTIDRDGQTMEMKSTEVWTLTAPSTLSVTNTMNTPNGERKTVMVYNKK
jgi:hypothetical protein